jgi:hypothetical protein
VEAGNSLSSGALAGGWGVTGNGQSVYCFDDTGKACFYIADNKLVPCGDAVTFPSKEVREPAIARYEALLAEAIAAHPDLAENDILRSRLYRLFALSPDENRAVVSFDDVAINLVNFADLSVRPLEIQDYPCPGIAMKSDAEFIANGILVKFGFDAEKTSCANNVVYQLFDDTGNYRMQIDDIDSNTSVIGCHYLTNGWLVYGNGTRIVFVRV